MALWRVADAEAALPRVRETLAECRAIMAELGELRAQAEDLRIIWGARVDDPHCPDHVEHQGYLRAQEDVKERLHDLLTGLADDGIQVRDLHAGIVDFLTLRGDETVCLCWQEGEQGILHWHPLHTGIAGRRPLPDLAVLEAAELA